MGEDEKSVTIAMSDFIDVALVIMAKTEDRDIIDFYLDLLPDGISESDFETFLINKQFLIIGYENLSKDMEVLKEICKENGVWV
jgi:hypothetical protein